MKIKTTKKVCTHRPSMNRYIKTMLTLFSFCFLSVSMIAQNISIKGVVKESTGDTAIGASVAVKGTATGAITDLNGNYTVQVPNEQAVLVFSLVGYKSQEVTVGAQRVIDITLKEDARLLDEVVVVGYGVQRKSDLTGSVSSIKPQDVLQTLPTGNITDALQGRLSGVSILSGSGDPSKENTIRIRGMNSVSGDKGPLVVIDGFIGGSLQTLNPSDIESIEVLKDASATAVYGSRGGNGVILVTTKSPKKETIVSFGSFWSFKTISKKPDMLSPYETAMLSNAYGREWYDSLSSADKIKEKAAVVYYNEDQLAAYKNGSAGFDYFDAVTNDPAIAQNYELSLTSGGENTSLLASVRYNKTEGVIKANYKETYNYRLKADTKVKSWLTLGLSASGYYASHKSPHSSQYQGIIQAAMYFPNTVDPLKEDKYQHLLPMRKLNNIYNPLAHITENKNRYTKLSNNILGYADFKIIDGLTFRTSMGIDFTNITNKSSQTEQGFNKITGNNPISFAHSTEKREWLNTNTLNYIKEFNEDHRVNFTAVYEQTYDTGYNHKSSAEGLFFPDQLGENSLQTGLKSLIGVTSGKENNSLQSWMLRGNYVFKNKYMLTASIRGDGTSRLAKQWAYFPSAAVAWDIKQENFLSEWNELSQLKFRVGYGSVGNQSIDAYRIYSAIKASESGIMSSDRAAADHLRWEKNNQTNVGLDAGFWNGRLSVSLDWYKKVTKDVLLELSQPIHMGFPTKLVNGGEIENQGIEVTISADPISTKDFSWHTDVTLTYNEGKFTKIPTANKMQQLPGGFENNVVRLIEGRKVATFWGYNYLGVWQEADLKAPFIGADGNPTGQTNQEKYSAVAGQARYEDKNKDGVHNINDQGEIGCGQPIFNWGWNNTFKYKDFDLSLFIVGFHGFDIYNATDQIGYGLLNGQNVDWANPKKSLLNRWTKENTNTNIPGFVKEIKSTNDMYSNRFVEKGDFVRMKSITVGYTLPQNLSNKLHIRNLRVYASVVNPFTITGYDGLDPESTLGSPLTQGVDWGSYPNSRDFIFGLNFSF